MDGEALRFHPERVDSWLSGERVFPLYVEVSPVGRCNHRCVFCAVDYLKYKGGMLDTDLMVESVFEMAELGVRSVMFAGEGEPLLHPDMDEVNEFAATHLDTAFTTNGVFLDRLETIAECSWVRVSVNGGTREEYGRIHRCKDSDWDDVWRNIEQAVGRKRNCNLGVQTLLYPGISTNDLYDRCDAAGVDYLTVKPYSQHRSSLNRFDEELPRPEISEKRCKFVFRENVFRTKEIAFSQCHATPHFWAYVMASGDVYGCSAYLGDERFRLGSLKTHGFGEIWQGPGREKVGQTIKDLDLASCRLNCRMARVNEYLEKVKNKDGVNFI